MKYILINGKKRSGKDHFATLIQSELDDRGFTSEIISYADPMKLILAETFDITLDELEEYKSEAAHIGIKGRKNTSRYKQVTNMRSVIQKFGTDAMKTFFGENVWVDLLLQSADNTEADYIIIPDFRFNTEYIEDSLTIKINNREIKDDYNSGHISENDLNDFEFDITIDNTGYTLTQDTASDILDELGV